MDQKRLDRLYTAMAFSAVIIALGIAGIWDYEDAVQTDAEYKMMVCAGYWPDYEDRKPDCLTRSLGPSAGRISN